MEFIASRVAAVLLIPSWVGFLYTKVALSQKVSFGDVPLSIAPVGPFTLTVLLITLLTLVCGSAGAEDGWQGSLSGWLRLLLYGFPFFGMISAFDPLSFSGG